MSQLFRKMFTAVGFICVVATAVFCQQVETVKSEHAISCGSKNYQLRLVRASTLLAGKDADAVAIVLTPDDASPSKLFGVYWVNATSPAPTHRDDTTDDSKLVSYGNGLTKDANQPAVNVFFSRLNCSPADPQVIGVQKVMGTDNLLRSLSPRQLTLQVVAQQLSENGVAVNPTHVQQASTGTLDVFRALSSKSERALDFAKAIRNHVSNLLATEGRDDQVGTKPSPQEEIGKLGAQKKDLEEKVKKFEDERAAFLGAAPGWLKVAFPFMSILSLGGLALIGLVAYHFVGRWRSPKPSSSTSQQTPTLGQEITRQLSDLDTAVDGVKRSIERIELNMGQRFEGDSALQSFWVSFYRGSKNYPKQLPDAFTKDLCDVVQLYHLLQDRCGKGGDSVAETVSTVQRLIRDLDSIRQNHLSISLENPRLEDIVGRIKTRLEQNAEGARELDRIRQSLSSHFRQHVNATDSVARLIEEQSVAQQRLGKYYRGDDFTQLVDAVVSSHQAILRETDPISVEQPGSISERVSSLANKYRTVKPKADRAEELEAKSKTLQTHLDNVSSELEAGKTLVDEITLELNFNTDTLNQQAATRIAATLNRLRNERDSSPYLQLRMGLSSALIALKKAIVTNGSAEHEELIDALFLHTVKKGLKNVLGKMEKCSGDQLWSDLLYEGFNEQWLHYLIRADLLLRTYYSTHQEFSLLRKAISLACTSILAALHDFQVEVVEVGLFEKLPTNMDTEAVYPGLRNLPAVMDKVELMVQNIKGGEVVVDVTSFPFVVRGVQENRGRAAIANPSAWLQQ